MTASPVPDSSTALAPWRLGSAVPVLSSALILAGIVAGAIRRAVPRRVTHGHRADAGMHTALDEVLTQIPDAGARIVLQTITLQAQSLTGSELAAAGIDGDATRSFRIWVHVGMSPEQAEQIGRPPRAVGLLGLLARDNHTVRVRDVRQHVEHLGLPAHHPPLASFLGVPIRFRGGVAGCLCLGNKLGTGEYTVEDQQMAEMLAARAAAALDTERPDGDAGAHAWLQTVLDQMPEGVLVVDGRGDVVVGNAAFRSFMHVTTSDNGRPDPRTIEMSRPSGERLPAEEFPVLRAAAEGEVTVGREFIARGPDNRPVPLLVSAAPLLTNDGHRDGAVMVCQDVSTVREIQRVREEWTSLVSHELRQPISVIALRSSLLLRGELTDDQREGIEQIARSVHSLGRMVTDLMDASLLDSDRLRVTPARVDLGQLLVEVVRRMPIVSPRTRTHVPGDVRVFVKGDAQRLEQVLANLLSNAVKYAAPETDIVVDLRLLAGQAHVRVINFGDAIPADELPFIFNRFARARAHTSTVKGLGLGLYIAKGLVTAHHGRIWVESVAGDCTTFHVTLPLDGPPVSVPPPPIDDAGGAGKESS